MIDMHVAIVCEYPTVNGGENSLLAMIERLPTIEVTVLAPVGGHLEERLGRQGIRHMPFQLDGDLDSRRSQLIEVIQQLQPTHLHANSLSMGRLIGPLREDIDIPRSAHLRDIIRLSVSAVDDLNQNDQLIAVSEATQEHHVRQGLDRLRTTVLYNGIDTDEFCPRASTGWLHAELGLPQESRFIASIGQIGLRKGLDIAARALIEISQVIDGVHWLIIGERYSTKEESRQFEQNLRQVITSAGRQQSVHWLGYRDDISRLLPECDLLLHAAHQEPLGRVLLEAAACGVPIVATDVGGTSEILTDCVSGRLVPSGVSQPMAEAACSVLADDSLAKRLTTNAREQILQNFTIEQQAAKLQAIWRRLTT